MLTNYSFQLNLQHCLSKEIPENNNPLHKATLCIGVSLADMLQFLLLNKIVVADAVKSAFLYFLK